MDTIEIDFSLETVHEIIIEDLMEHQDEIAMAFSLGFVGVTNMSDKELARRFHEALKRLRQRPTLEY